MTEPRYQKNIGLVGEAGQEKLLRSHVAIVGAGGLGGTVFEILVRYGVGKITIVDFDDFEEANLNRQLLSTMPALRTNKAIAAVERARAVNPSAQVIAHAQRLTDENADRLIAGADLICDCLGNIRDRFVLGRAAARLGIPLVHASVAGAEGRITTIFPGDRGFQAIYGDESAAPPSGEELRQGTPPSSVFAIASMQAHEAIAVLTGIQPPLRQTLLLVNLGDWRLKLLKLS